MACITDSKMRLLQWYLRSGKEVIITTTSSGKKSIIQKNKVYDFYPFSHINSHPFIGMGSAVIEITDAGTGRVILKNTIINPDCEWYGYCMMSWLRFRSYGFSVALGLLDFKEMPKIFLNWISRVLYYRPYARLKMWLDIPVYQEDEPD